MGRKFKLFLLVLLVLAASASKMQQTYLTQDQQSLQSSQSTHEGHAFEAQRLLQNGVNSFPVSNQDQSFNSQDITPANQNLDFGTFQDQQPAKKTTDSQIPSQKAGTQPKQQEAAQKTPSNSGNSNANASKPADSTLVPAKKQQVKALPAQIQKPVLGKALKINQGISYQRLHIGQIQKKYLFLDFTLAEKDKWQKAKITVTLQGTQNKIIECQYDGHDSCYIFKQKLKAQTILFLSIKCQDDCTYNFNSHWSDLQHLTPGTSYTFAFGKDTFQLYHVELKDRDFKEFRVHIAPRTTRKPFDNIKMYGKYGSNTGVTTTDYDFKSVNLWEDGQGLFLSASDIRQKNFDLLLVGQTESTYQLICELITKSDHTIEDGQHIYEYLKAGQSKSYHISGFDTKRFTEFSLKVSIMTGNLEVDYFRDRNLKNKIPFSPFKYMDDSQFIFQANQIAQFASTGLYVRITSKSMQNQSARDATFTISFQGRQASDAIELHEYVYGFVPVMGTKFAYFNFKRWLQQTETYLQFSVSVLQIIGKAKFQFLICKDRLHSCTKPDNYKTVTEPIPESKKEISQKERYSFYFSDSYLKNINNLQQQGIIVVKITQEDQKATGQANKDSYGLVALEFINNNKVLFLREGRPLQDKLSANEMKLYKYINSDENVKQIRIHINEIAGVIKSSGVIKQAFSDKVLVNIEPEGSTLRFKTNLTLPIMIIIRAEQKSIFGISMQVILKDDNTGMADIRSIGQDLAYTVRINPDSYTIFEITPIFYEFFFIYESSQSVLACPINITTSECLNPNTQPESTALTAEYKPSQKGEIKDVRLSAQRKARVKIINPFKQSTAQVSIIFHSRSFDHCGQKKVGRAYSQNVKNGTCYTYFLQGEEDTGLQLYISKRQLANMTYSVLICGNSIKDAFKLKTLGLTPQIFKEHCKNNLQSRQISIYWYVNTNNAGASDLNVKVDFVVQKTGGMVILPEGLGYSVLTKARDGALRTFGFSLINKIDTRIYIHQIIGRFKAFARIIREDDRENENISQINAHVHSVRGMSYEQQPIIVVPQKMIEETKCDRCFLLIAVFTDNQQGGRTVQFQIQVVQRFQTLSDDSSTKGYLEAGSTAYYTYRAKESIQKQASLIFFLSDHHQRCANMYIHILQMPGPKFALKSAFEANELIYNHQGPETKYFLSVQAVKTCEYALSVLLYDTSIHRLERGKQNMLKLAKGQIRYFTFPQYTDQPFKILSILKFGDIKLHLNASNIAIEKRTFTTEQLEIQKFEVKSQNSNALAVSSTDKIYCKNCDYFLAAEALSTTFATLFLVYPNTIIPLYKNKFFADYMQKKNDFTLASYNSLQKSKIQVVVHSGSIEIQAIYKQYKESRTFAAKEEIQIMKIEIGQDVIKGTKPKLPAGKNVDPYFNSMTNAAVAYDEKIPINFIIRALSGKSSYTLEVKSLSTKGDLSGYTQYQNIKAGQPNHIQISNNKVLCLNGAIGDNQEILLTTNGDNKDNLKKLAFNAKMRESTKANVKTQILKNIIAIRLQEEDTKDKPKYQVSSYEVCLKLDTADQEEKKEKQEQKKNEKEKQQEIKEQAQKNITEAEAIQNFDDVDNFTFKAVVTQANSVNLISSDTETLVRGAKTYVVHSDGEFILDVFECKGEAKVSYSDSLASLKSSKPKLLESFGVSEQKHAVKISQNETTFINITSQQAVIRWLPLNFQTDLGTGYLKFEAGDVRYESKFKIMNILYQPLQLTKKTKSKVNQIKYVLYVSNDSSLVDYAAQCSYHESSDVTLVNLLQLPFRSNPQQQQQYITYGIDKGYLQNRFNGSDNIYFTIVAKLVLQISKSPEEGAKFKNSISDQHQHYRFIYSRQQMPLQAYKPSKIQSIPYGFLGLIVGSILIILLVTTFLFTRKIAPWIARLRTRHLVEDQEAGQNKQDLEMVPPSSDRNQRAPGNALQTQEKMKS